MKKNAFSSNKRTGKNQPITGKKLLIHSILLSLFSFNCKTTQRSCAKTNQRKNKILLCPKPSLQKGPNRIAGNCGRRTHRSAPIKHLRYLQKTRIIDLQHHGAALKQQSFHYPPYFASSSGFLVSDFDSSIFCHLDSYC